MPRRVGFVNTMSSGSRYKAQQRPILPLDIVSTAPTPVVFNECVYVRIRVKHHFQQFFSHIMTVSGYGGELNAHFYSAASLKYHVPDTWHDTTPSHITCILTLGRPVLALPRKSECQAMSS